MTTTGDVLDLPQLGLTITLRRTGAQTAGALLEFDVVGAPRGFVALPHVHPGQTERHEVLEGRMAMTLGGRTRVLGPGDVVETPAGTRHRHRSADGAPGRMRVQLRPAGGTEAWLRRVADMAAEGGLTARGFPRPAAGARLVRDFAGESHGAWPPPRVQDLAARAILAVADGVQRSGRYRFVDAWHVDAPPEAVFATLADSASYPRWWRPVYLEARPEGPGGVGQRSSQRFTGRLPYALRTTTVVTRHEPPHLLEADVDGDLRGTGRWTLTAAGAGTDLRFDWDVEAGRALLRRLGPVLRPAFRANHAWAVARAIEGLEPEARARAAADTAGVSAGTSSPAPGAAPPPR